MKSYGGSLHVECLEHGGGVGNEVVVKQLARRGVHLHSSLQEETTNLESIHAGHEPRRARPRRPTPMGLAHKG